MDVSFYFQKFVIHITVCSCVYFQEFIVHIIFRCCVEPSHLDLFLAQTHIPSTVSAAIR